MSEVKTNKLTGTTSAGNVTVTGEGGSGTIQMQQGLLKCWVHLDGNPVGIDDSFNAASATDSGTGRYTLAMTSAMNNTDYAVPTAFGRNTAGSSYALGNAGDFAFSQTTTQFRVEFFTRSSSLGDTFSDTDNYHISVAGDLA